MDKLLCETKGPLTVSKCRMIPFTTCGW